MMPHVDIDRVNIVTGNDLLPGGTKLLYPREKIVGILFSESNWIEMMRYQLIVIDMY